MTTILKEMGIQQWRLREHKPAEVAAEVAGQSAADFATLAPVPLKPEHDSSEFDNSNVDNSQVDNSGNDGGQSSASDAVVVEDTEPKQRGQSFAADELLVADNNDGSSIAADVGSGDVSAIDSKADSAVGVATEKANNAAPVPMPMPAPMPASNIQPAPDANPAPTVNKAPEPAASSGIEQADLNKTLDWRGLQETIDGRNQCSSCGAGNTMLGAGDANADWLFIADAPTRIDLASSQLFSGRAGQLYEAMLLAVGLDRTRVYTSSVFKCVASDDLSVVPSCDKLLIRQIELLQPKVIVALGEFAAQSVARSNESLEKLRGQNLFCPQTKVPIVASYSVLSLLDQPALKSGAWSDLKKCIAITR